MTMLSFHKIEIGSDGDGSAVSITRDVKPAAGGAKSFLIGSLATAIAVLPVGVLLHALFPVVLMSSVVTIAKTIELKINETIVPKELKMEWGGSQRLRMTLSANDNFVHPKAIYLTYLKFTQHTKKRHTDQGKVRQNSS
jgi:hypothetical protein